MQTTHRTLDCEVVERVPSGVSAASEFSRYDCDSGSSTPVFLRSSSASLYSDALKSSARRMSIECLPILRRNGSHSQLSDTSSTKLRRKHHREVELIRSCRSVPGTPPRRCKIPSILSADDPVFARLKVEESFLNYRRSSASPAESSPRLSASSTRESGERPPASESAPAPSSDTPSSDAVVAPQKKESVSLFSSSRKQSDVFFDRWMLVVVVIVFLLTSVGILITPEAQTRRLSNSRSPK
eukprot:3703606-Rhodomonas_salina.1